MRFRIAPLAGMAALAVAATMTVTAQQPPLGMRSPEQAAADNLVEPDFASSNVYNNADFQTGGTGLRNQKRGTMMVNGVPGGAAGPVIQAFVYNAIITNGAAATLAERTFQIKRLSPSTKLKPGTVTVVANEIATTGSPCWGGTALHVLKADVTSVVTGSGLYQITPKKSGSTAGGDPWVPPTVFPLQEGASMVIVYQNSGTITSVYDGPALSQMFSGTFSYSLNLPAATSSVKMDFIGADGQYGSSRSSTGSADTTSVNGVALGPGSAWNDSMWNGTSALPLPLLWDDAGRRFSLASTAVLNVTHNATNDCVVPIANVVSQP